MLSVYRGLVFFVRGDVMEAVHKLFDRLERQIEMTKPANTIHYIVDMLCHY